MAPLGSSPPPWLKPLGLPYGLCIRLRNLAYDAGWIRPRRLPLPVVSVGNLAAGGTGKTPLVCWLLEALEQRGLRAGVLSRGYRRRPGEVLNDEGRMLQGRFPELRQVQDPDRHAGGRRLCEGGGLDLVLLDDGFQHRRLHRDRDLVCLDAADPLMGGSLLPGGFLREPPSSLRRADLVVLTGSEELPPGGIEAARRRIEPWYGDRPALPARSLPLEILELPGPRQHAPEALRGRACHLLAGIARPERFRRSLERLGASVEETTFLRDHSEIPEEDLAELSSRAGRRGAWLLLTEKDEARLDLAPGTGPRRFVLRMRLCFEGEAPLELFLPEGILGGSR